MAAQAVRAALESDAYVRNLISFKAHQLIRHRGFSRSDLEDVQQELAMALSKQAHHFEPSRGSLHTFADRVLGTAARMILRERRAQKRDAGGSVWSLETTILNADGGGPTQLGDALSDADQARRTGSGSAPSSDQEALKDDVAIVLGGLHPEVREVILKRRDNSEEVVARELGISRREYRKIRDSIRKRFEMHGFGNS